MDDTIWRELIRQLRTLDTPIIHTGYWICEGAGPECGCEHPGRKGYHPAIGVADFDSFTLNGFCFSTPEVALDFLERLTRMLCDHVGLEIGPNLSMN